MVGVAQLVRAPGCGPGCRGFESPRSPHRLYRVTCGFDGNPKFFLRLRAVIARASQECHWGRFTRVAGSAAEHGNARRLGEAPNAWPTCDFPPDLPENGSPSATRLGRTRAG